jgi:hypothetical protein
MRLRIIGSIQSFCSFLKDSFGFAGHRRGIARIAIAVSGNYTGGFRPLIRLPMLPPLAVSHP